MKLPEDMDKECIPICEAINLFSPDISTEESCCGHNKKRFAIWFNVENLKTLGELLYFFDPCHNGFDQESTDRAYSHHVWQIRIKTDCAMTYPTIYLEGGIGEKAYQQADEIAKAITVYFYEEREKQLEDR